MARMHFASAPFSMITHFCARLMLPICMPCACLILPVCAQAAHALSLRPRHACSMFAPAPHIALFSPYFSIYRSVNRHVYGQFAAQHVIFLLYSGIMRDSIKFYIHHYDVSSYNDMCPHYATFIAPGVSKADGCLAESAFTCLAPRCIKISACVYLQADI